MPQANGHTDGCGKPDSGSGGQALHILHRAALQNSPCAKKADAGDQALDHPGNVLEAHAGLHRHQYQQRRAKGHQHMRAQSGGLAFALAFIAQQAAENRCDQQAAADPRRILQVGDIGKLRGHGTGDDRPPFHVLLHARLVQIWSRGSGRGFATP